MAVGGSDAGISAALRARELDPSSDVSVLVADEYPNFSICGIPYHVSGEVPDWRNLAHRTAADLEATGMQLHLRTVAERIDVAAHEVHVIDSRGEHGVVGYDALVVGTGALPVRPRITGLDVLGHEDGVHVLHSMGDTFSVMETLTARGARSADDAHQSAGRVRGRDCAVTHHRLLGDSYTPPLGSPWDAIQLGAQAWVRSVTT